LGEDESRAGEDAEGAKMMLADPGGMEANLFGVDRLVEAMSSLAVCVLISS
jgi:hypothetical protein